jgi:hypothetical protein
MAAAPMDPPPPDLCPGHFAARGPMHGLELREGATLEGALLPRVALLECKALR